MPWSRNWSFPAWVREGRRPEHWPLIVLPTPPRVYGVSPMEMCMREVRAYKRFMEGVVYVPEFVDMSWYMRKLIISALGFTPVTLEGKDNVHSSEYQLEFFDAIRQRLRSKLDK